MLYDCYYPNGDIGRFIDNSGVHLYLANVMSELPTEAIRITNNDEYYLVYDSDTGIRVFVWSADYSADINDEYHIYGYPMYMAETLSYSNFKSIEIGDSAAEVEAIDPKVVEIFLREYQSRTLEKVIEGIEGGNPPVSRHLLTDGLLVITYGRDEDGFFVSNIEFHEDFTIDTIGGSQCCKIDPLDYVTQG